MSKISYRPLGNRLLVEQLPIEEGDKEQNGIIVPENAIPHRRGIVVAVGDGETAPATGLLQPTTCKVGDKVLYLNEAAYVPIRIDNVEYRLMREPQIEAIIE
jgi:co-chaperonin GroES (HSP10)